MQQTTSLGLALPSSFSKALEAIQRHGGDIPLHKRYWVADTLETSHMDPNATPMEIDIWRAAAIRFCCEHGVSHQTINAIKAMAGCISFLSDSERPTSERLEDVDLNSFAKV